MKTGKHSIPVKLVFVRNRNKKSDYIIILKWLRRKSNDQKTICELFYVCCEDIQDIELSTAMKQLLKILCDGIKNRAITITKEIKTQLTNWFVSQPSFIQALYPEFMWEV